MNYLRNCWYMAGWADELGDQPLARTFLGEAVVLFRGDDGPAALADRCPHRLAPLSAGTVSGSDIRCRYHGLAFGADGACSLNPHGPITRAMRVRHYPVHEAFRALWIWMGDPDLADLAKLRDLSFLADAPETAFSKGYLLGQGNYQLFTDNILDLTHADFLHPDTLGGGAFTRTRGEVRERDGVISVHWHAFGHSPSPVMASRMGGNVDKVDSWTEVDWAAPAIMTLRSGATTVGGSRQDGKSSLNVHIMTPETATTTHYFYAATRNYALDDIEVNRRITEMRDRVFATEDAPIIAGQQRRMGDAGFWELGLALMETDEGLVRVRRALEKMIRSERDAAIEPAPVAAAQAGRDERSGG